jgi:hypothetical protein
MARKKKTKSWRDTYEFYGIKNYTWNKSWNNLKKNGVRSQLSKEWGMIGKALSTGKLTYTRLIVETLILFAIGFGIGCLIGKLLIWIF